MEYTYDYYKKSADYIRSVSGGFQPELGIVLGTGLGEYDRNIENRIEIPYGDIPNFLVSTAPDHAGKLILGTIEGHKVCCMSGRFHSYEGYSFEQLALPVRVMKVLGIQRLILTNAAGAINTSYSVGDIMVIKDHIKLTGASPLAGPNIPEFGQRFFDIGNMYDKELRTLALNCADATSLTIREGVYFFFTGPQYETPAEIRAARILGGDAAGMSTVTEALTAAHCGIPVLGLSVMTNMAAGVLDQPLTAEEVTETSLRVAGEFERYFTEILRRLL
ncbi:MAG TPA: purine-nucleoside phosphorylase [Clostridiales bacterium]|nr:purine-nucleoside phosphorylase [Clostridiales bacterium]